MDALITAWWIFSQVIVQVRHTQSRVNSVKIVAIARVQMAAAAQNRLSET
jgi:hypothetical protein